MKSNIKNNIVKILTIIYFINALLEVFAESISNTILIVIAKPLIPFLLIGLYWFTSTKQNILFYLTLFFSIITNVLFIPNSPKALFYGIIAFTFHRLLIVYYVFILSKIKDFRPFVLATIPLFFIFFYLLLSTTDVPQGSYVILIIQNVLVAIFGGIAISNYIMNDIKQNSFLLISALFFIGLQLVIFVEKYYLNNFSIHYIRPLAMTLNVLAFYTFYKYVIAAELNNN